MSALKRLAPYLWYPVTMSAAVMLFALLLAEGAPTMVAVYVPIVFAGLTVLWLQRRYPERQEWRPNPATVMTDLTFMGVVQLALPQGLATVLALALADRAHADGANPAWPHAWPLAAQICLMLMLVDLLRYWLHRACHRLPFLWRLHAIHHSPRMLYSLNSGRFHPVEKTLQFCVDTVPFVALGVQPAVIAGYFVLYAANGLFQHSNVRLRYGWLNYVVGSAETHRWHHARDAWIGACNFGSTIAIWDLIFGTWRLPRRLRLDEVGIMDESYPTSFWAQMVIPYRGWRSRRFRQALARGLANVLVAGRLCWTLLIQGWRIAGAARDPMEIQHRLLARILRDNRDSAFGRRFRFGDIGGYDAFARGVPVADYENLRPYVEAEIARGEHALTQDRPTQYVRTSGSTGKPKDIPLTRVHLEALRRIHQTAVAFQYRTCPRAFAGSILAIVSPACEGVLPNGTPFGSASGIVAGNTPAAVKEKFVLPGAVSTISDSRVKYLLILRLALADPYITYIGTANSTTLLALMALYREHWPVLLEDLRRGTFFLAERLPAMVRSALGSRLDACPERAAEIEALHARTVEPRMADLWPSLHAVVTWTCASAGTAVSALRRELAPHTRLLELGYIASEFRATIALGRRRGAGMPTLDTHFFEFVERDRWDRGAPELLTLDRIRKGVDYYIIVTTPSGLYRYFINDLVRVTGFLHRMPLLRFVQKGRGVTSITGEKLYECQVLEAVQSAMTELGCALHFVVMLADEEARAYRLYVEPEGGAPIPAEGLADSVDAKLARLNLEYRAKRESRRLGPIDAHWLRPHAGEAYKQFCVANGQRDGQFKPLALAYRRGIGFDFEHFLSAA